jgi:glycosyltransferase involved in cell wall biosynthesis
MDKLKVLVVHCIYQFKGGEDSVMESEVELLRAAGHDVRVYLRHNKEADSLPAWRLTADTIWSTQAAQEIKALVDGWRPDVMHVHNTVLRISPSVYWAAQSMGIPVVQTLHNFRLACIGALFLRDGQICEDCLGHLPWRGVVRGCYRQSKAQSAVLAASVTLHRGLGTYRQRVDRYIALTDFGRSKFIQAGLPAEKISVKPNFVEWREPSTAATRTGGMFVGRLSEEKGIAVLLKALKALETMPQPAQAPPRPFAVLGTGPLEQEAAQQLGANHLGFQPADKVMAHMERSLFMVLPSICYEGFPRTIVEAFACGLPVIASRLGSMAELIEDHKTGLLFEPGDSHDLARKLAWAYEHPQEMLAMGQQARQTYEARFTPQRNLAQLLDIYRQAMVCAQTARG